MDIIMTANVFFFFPYLFRSFMKILTTMNSYAFKSFGSAYLHHLKFARPKWT